MSEHDWLRDEMNRLSDKLDQVLTVVSDIRANEKATDMRFNEVDRRLKELEEKAVTHDQFEPVNRAYVWTLRTLITTVVTGLLALVIIQPDVDAIITKQKDPKQQVSQAVEE